MVVVNDESAPEPDALSPKSGSVPGSGSAATKPKRRFAPQLIEQSSRSSSGRKQQHDPSPDVRASANTNTNSNSNPNSDIPPSDGRAACNATARTTETTAVHNDNMSTPRPTKPIRRFAPVPIETTFDSYRVANKNPHGPAPEPTPDPSPVTSEASSTFSATAVPTTPESTQTRERDKRPTRRFAPQLIETTRRAWRAGQAGPATKPTDKTDITPGTNHIYAPKPKREHGAPRPGKSSNGLTRTIPEHEETVAARFLSPRRQHSTKAHPNTRRATRNNSYQPGLDTILSSESGNSSAEEDGVAAPALNLGVPALSDGRSNQGSDWSTSRHDVRTRRESCDEEFSGYLLGIAAREAHRQREFEQALSAFPNGIPPQGVEHFFARDNSEDDLQVGDGDPPLRHGTSQLLRRKSTDPGWAVKEMRAHAEKLARMRAETHLSLDDNSDSSDIPPPSEDMLWTATATARHDSRDSAMGSSMGHAPSTHSPALFTGSLPGHDKPLMSSSSGLRASPFGIPLAFRASNEDGELCKMRKAASPPMLGADLSFRTCPSPKFTRMEPNQPYSQFDRLEKNQRDASGSTGLWRGYCSSKTNNKLNTPSLQPPILLHTPGVPCSPADPFAAEFEVSVVGGEVQSPMWTSGCSQSNLHPPHFPGLDEKLEREKMDREREEAILAEFDDAFITQVYNYLSLGYAATARAFDDELSKISGICVEELRKDDNAKVGKGFMREMEISPSRGSTDSSSSDESESEQAVTLHGFVNGQRPRHKPPRWKALKLYIREWARQHPTLNVDDDSGPPAWGVRARRGSWAI